MPYRYVVIVPRSAPETLAYLSRSFQDVPDVEVIVDRREARASTPPPVVDRRASACWTREAFGCALVRIEVPISAPAREAVPADPASAVAPPVFDVSAPAENGAVHFRAVPDFRGAGWR
jgi:hypothetical protein